MKQTGMKVFERMMTSDKFKEVSYNDQGKQKLHTK